MVLDVEVNGCQELVNLFLYTYALCAFIDLPFPLEQMEHVYSMPHRAQRYLIV